VNPVLLYFISGESLYSGAALLLCVLILSLLRKQEPFVRIRNLIAWLALILIVMAAPPFSWVLIAVFFAAFVAWYFSCNTAASREILQVVATLALGAVVFYGIALEYPHRRLPIITGPVGNKLVVLGDSVSAGLDPRVAWPRIMQQSTGIQVRNLSRVGATTADGAVVAAQVTPDDGTVLVEIGGNDLIAGLSSSRFERSLDLLLARVTSGKRMVVMMELPLLPYRIGYGRAQRRLASKYGVWLIPKRYFVEVISGSDATLDGLHLTPEGSTRMAKLVAHVLSPVLRPGSTS
jgi:acyl-CoA thioesterase-1